MTIAESDIETRKITNNGLELEVINYGATILALRVTNKDGKLINIAAGLEKPEDYLSSAYKLHNLYLGCCVGRYAGRISSGKLCIDNEEYTLYHEDGVHLHGGKQGFDKKLWKFEEIDESKPLISLSYISKDGEEGYPGNLKVLARYELLNTNCLKITYEAETDKATPVSLTNHTYFNLNGKGSITNHFIEVHSEKVLEVEKDLISTGNIINSTGTRFDLQKKKHLGGEDFKGFDDTFILENKAPKAAALICPESGIVMTTSTNQPAMVIYTPLKFPKLKFYDDAEYDKYPAICLETQNYPDAPNKANFPNSILHPGEQYKNETVFEFSKLDL